MKQNGNNPKNGYNHQDYVTAVTFLNRTQIDCLDKMGKDFLFKQGHKLSRSKILSELVDFLAKVHVDVNKIDLERESLADGIMRQMKDEDKATG